MKRLLLNTLNTCSTLLCACSLILLLIGTRQYEYLFFHSEPWESSFSIWVRGASLNFKLAAGRAYWSTPLPALAALFAIFPLLYLLQRVRIRRVGRERRSKGQCQQGGYDLRGSPERCPECGTAEATTDPHANLGPHRGRSAEQD